MARKKNCRMECRLERSKREQQVSEKLSGADGVKESMREMRGSGSVGYRVTDSRRDVLQIT